MSLYLSWWPFLFLVGERNGPNPGLEALAFIVGRSNHGSVPSLGARFGDCHEQSQHRR